MRCLQPPDLSRKKITGPALLLLTCTWISGLVQWYNDSGRFARHPARTVRGRDLWVSIPRRNKGTIPAARRAGGPFRMANARKRQVLAVVTLLFVFAWHSASFAQSAPATKTQVVMLGTGTPLPDPDRSGPSTAIVVNGTGYIVDAGTGVVRRAAAARDKGVQALEPTNLRIAFLTHLHADHTLGLPDLILTPWIMGRKQPLELY